MIVVKTVDKKVYELDATGLKNVADLSKMLAVKHGIPESRQQLIFRGKVLKDPAEALPEQQEGSFFVLMVKKAPPASAPVAAEERPSKKPRIDPLADPHCAQWYSKLSDEKKENVRKAIAGETTRLDLSWCGEHRTFEPEEIEVSDDCQNGIEEIPDGILASCPQLKVLDLTNQNYLKRLPNSFGSLTCLTTVHNMGCRELEVFPESTDKLRKLRSVYMHELRPEERSRLEYIIHRNRESASQNATTSEPETQSSQPQPPAPPRPSQLPSDDPDANGLALVTAAETGNLDSVQKCLALRNSSLDWRCPQRRNATALIAAAVRGHFDVVCALIEANADPSLKDDFGLTALDAVKEDYEVTHESKFLSVRSYLEVINGAANVTPAVLDAAAAAAAPYALGEAAECGQLDRVLQHLQSPGIDINWQDERGRTALFRAAAEDHLEIVKLLVARYADLTVMSTDGQSAAESAEGLAEVYLESIGDKPICAQTLTDADAAVGTAASKEVFEMVPLAIRLPEYMEEFKRLITVPGVDLDYSPSPSRCSSRPPLIQAVKVHLNPPHACRFDPYCVEVVEALLNAKANPNKVTEENETPLMHAAFVGHLGVVKALVKGGADPNASHQGRTPLEAAQKGLSGTLDMKIPPQHQAQCNAVAYYLSELLRR